MEKLSYIYAVEELPGVVHLFISPEEDKAIWVQKYFLGTLTESQAKEFAKPFESMKAADPLSFPGVKFQFNVFKSSLED